MSRLEFEFTCIRCRLRIRLLPYCFGTWLCRWGPVGSGVARWGPVGYLVKPLLYINSVRGANRLWGETSMGRNTHGAKCLWGKMSNRGAKSLHTLYLPTPCVVNAT